MVVPDYMTALVGYRAWNVTSEGDLLSLNTNTGELWPAQYPKQALCASMRDKLYWSESIYCTSSSYYPMAACVAHSFEALLARRKRQREIAQHHPPEANCSCGIYAAKSDQTTHFKMYQADSLVWGEVYLWGKIQEHSEGYRAEFAYPKTLSTSSPYAEKIAAKYGVPCVSVPQLTLAPELSQQTLSRSTYKSVCMQCQIVGSTISLGLGSVPATWGNAHLSTSGTVASYNDQDETEPSTTTTITAQGLPKSVPQPMPWYIPWKGLALLRLAQWRHP